MCSTIVVVIVIYIADSNCNFIVKLERMAIDAWVYALKCALYSDIHAVDWLFGKRIHTGFAGDFVCKTATNRRNYVDGDAVPSGETARAISECIAPGAERRSRGATMIRPLIT